MNFKPKLTSEFIIYLALFGSARLMAAFWLTPNYSEFTSFHYPFAQLSDHGLYPFVHFWQEYPPLFPYLSVGVYRALGLIWTPGQLGHYEAYELVMQGLMSLTDLVNAALIYLLVARGAGEKRGAFAGIAFLFSFTAVFVSSGFFDGLVLCFMLYSLWSFLEDRPVGAGIALGLGVVTKLVPVAILPALIKFRKDNSQLKQLLGGFGVTAALLWGSFFLVNYELAVMPVRANGARPGWETVWALIEGQYQFGFLGPEKMADLPLFPEPAIKASEKLKFFAGGADERMLKVRVLSRFSPDISSFPQTQMRSLYMITGLIFAVLFVVTWAKIPGRGGDRVIPYAGFLFVMLLLYSKGWSPQFVIFPAAFILLLYPSALGAAALLALLFINFLEMPVWLYYVRGTSSGSVFLGVVVLMRTAFFCLLGWLLFKRCSADA